MKIIVRFLLVLLLVTGAVVFALQWKAIAAARAEHQVLMGESEEARRLGEQNKEIARLRGEHEEFERLRQENKDLPKLRNEIRQLRRKAEALATLRADNLRLRSQAPMVSEPNSDSVPPGFIARAALVDAGFGTPESTVQTFFWAMSRGNLERMSECTLAGRQGLNQDLEWQRRQLAEEMKDFTGLSVARRRDISPDEVELMLQSTAGGATLPMKLQRTDSGWKLEQ